MLTITDINGNTEGLSGYKNLKRYRNVSGEKSLAFFVMPTSQNAHSFEMVAEESIVEFDGEPYRIKQMTEKPRGGTYVKEVVALHTFFDLIDDHKYEVHNGSLTFDAALDFALAGTGYTYVVLDTFYAESFENLGDDNRLSLLQTMLKRYGAEFSLNGTQLTFRKRIGNATDFQFRYNYNVKTLARDVNTNNLSTYIKGYGKDGLTSEYTSPNAAVFGLRHAKPVRDERYTTLDGLNERLQAEIIDTPEVSITVDFADMRRAGFPYDVPNEGDDVFLIYEPMGIDVEARVMEITELFTETSDLPIKTEVTIANLRSSVIDRWANTEKQVRDMIGSDGKVKFSILDAAVQRATEALQSAQTELEFNNGIIARSKVNPNHVVLVNSAGIGVSTDGGATFNYAMTGEGIVADLITVGTMLFDRMKGGTLTLGGLDNGNGRLITMDENGEVIADLNAELGGFEFLRIGRVISDSVVNVLNTPISYYVHPTDGNDNNGGTGNGDYLRTVTEALNRLPKYLNANVEIIITQSFTGNYGENIRIEGFHGTGKIRVLYATYTQTLDGYFEVANCSCPIEFDLADGVINLANKSGFDGVVTVNNCQNVKIIKAKLYGNNAVQYGVMARNSTVNLEGVEVYDVALACIAGERSIITQTNCKGLSAYGLFANLATILGGEGTAPGGTTSNTYAARGGMIPGTFTANTGAATPPPAPQQTKVWTAQSAANWSTSGYWDSDAKQGNFGYGRRTGYWFFSTDLSATVSGKTIKNIKVLVKRKNSGGVSGGVDVYLRWHTLTSKPSGAPSDIDLSGDVKTVRLAWGESKWVELPSAFYDDFASGAAKGIGIYVASDSSSNYAIMDSNAKIEVTYA